MGARLSSSKPCHCRCRYSSVCLLTSRKADTRRPGEPALSNITPTDPFGDRCCRDTASRIHRAPSNEDGVCVHHNFQLSGRSRSVKRAARLIACAGLIAAGKKRRSRPGTSREKTRRLSTLWEDNCVCRFCCRIPRIVILKSWYATI